MYISVLFVNFSILPVQNIYAWLNPKTFYSDLEYGVRCYVTLGDGQRMCHPYKTVRIEQLKTSDFQFRDPETGQEWTTKTPVKDSSDTEYVDYIRARHGMQEVCLSRVLVHVCSLRMYFSNFSSSFLRFFI